MINKQVEKYFKSKQIEGRAENAAGLPMNIVLMGQAQLNIGVKPLPIQFSVAAATASSSVQKSKNANLQLQALTKNFSQ